VRRVSPVDLMLLATVLLWAMNATTTRYIVTHGFRPLAYASTRYAAASLLFVAFTWWRERSFRIARRDVRLVLLGGCFIFLNQLAFVYGTKLTSATTIGLMLGTVPIWAAIIGRLVGLERPTPVFWLAATVSFIGVGLTAAGSGGGLSGALAGNVLALLAAVSWAAYSVTITPLMRRYSPFRISSLVLSVGCVPLTLVSIPQLRAQDYGGFGATMWLAWAFAVVGSIFLTNLLYFTAIDRVGLSRATLFGNLQPFFAVLFAVLLLGEHLTALELAGGAAIAAGIAIERRWRHVPIVTLARE